MKNAYPARQLLKGYSWPMCLPELTGCDAVYDHLSPSRHPGTLICSVHWQKQNHVFPTGRVDPKPPWEYS